MNRRRFLRRSLAGSAALTLAGCAPADLGPRRKIVYAGAFSLARSVDEALWLQFERRVERALPDNDLRLLIRGEVGPEEQTFASLRRGRIQVAGGSFAGVATLVPEIGLLSLPFLFDSEDEVDFVMDRYMLDSFRELFGRIGLYLLHWTEVGWVNLYGKRPLKLPTDARGQRVRASSSIASQAFIREIGADTITLPFSDVLPSLQTGLIDAGVTSVTMYALSGIPSEAPHYVLTRHTYDMGVLIANDRWLGGLTPREHDVYSQGLGGATATRRAARDSVAALMKALPAQGVKLHDPTPAERETWRRSAWPAHEKLIRQIGSQAQRIYDTLLEGKAAWKTAQSGAAAAAAASATAGAAAAFTTPGVKP